jgi:uncharacterized membrane protein YkvA (DUF1232 family)
MMQGEYSKYYSEKSLWQKIKKFSKQAGIKVIYAVLLLYYAMMNPKTSVKSKVLIVASLGYFILPADAIFDLTPIIGFSDDLGVLIFALNQISSMLTTEVKENARKKVGEWFSNIDEKDFVELEEKVFNPSK